MPDTIKKPVLIFPKKGAISVSPPRACAAYCACLWHSQMGQELSPDKKERARKQWLAWEDAVMSPTFESDPMIFEDE